MPVCVKGRIVPEDGSLHQPTPHHRNIPNQVESKKPVEKMQMENRRPMPNGRTEQATTRRIRLKEHCRFTIEETHAQYLETTFDQAQD